MRDRKEEIMKKFWESFKKGTKKLWEEDPQSVLTMVGVTTAAIAVIVKAGDAVSAAQGRRAYAKQVNYRVKNRK
jgi:hypothetical protein